MYSIKSTIYNMNNDNYHKKIIVEVPIIRGPKGNKGDTGNPGLIGQQGPKGITPPLPTPSPNVYTSPLDLSTVSPVGMTGTWNVPDGVTAIYVTLCGGGGGGGGGIYYYSSATLVPYAGGGGGGGAAGISNLPIIDPNLGGTTFTFFIGRGGVGGARNNITQLMSSGTATAGMNGETTTFGSSARNINLTGSGGLGGSGASWNNNSYVGGSGGMGGGIYGGTGGIGGSATNTNLEQAASNGQPGNSLYYPFTYGGGGGGGAANPNQVANVYGGSGGSSMIISGNNKNPFGGDGGASAFSYSNYFTSTFSFNGYGAGGQGCVPQNEPYTLGNPGCIIVSW